jgi:hypothetical protein
MTSQDEGELQGQNSKGPKKGKRGSQLLCKGVQNTADLIEQNVVEHQSFSETIRRPTEANGRDRGALQKNGQRLHYCSQKVKGTRSSPRILPKQFLVSQRTSQLWNWITTGSV